jgi:hypothetical protein
VAGVVTCGQAQITDPYWSMSLIESFRPALQFVQLDLPCKALGTDYPT